LDLVREIEKHRKELIFENLRLRAEIAKLTLLSDSQLANQERLAEELAAAGNAMERDRTSLAAAVTGITKAIKMRDWLAESRGPYEWDDDRFYSEFSAALNEILQAIEPLRKIAADWTGCPKDAASVEAARTDLRAELATERANQERLVGEREDRQRTIGEWAVAAFGEAEALSLPQRGLRLLEEAAEAAQASGVGIDQARHLLSYVWDRPVGRLSQELGGVGVTALALAHAAGFSADGAEKNEIARVLARPLEHFTKRNHEKNNAGLPAPKDTPTEPTQEK
jgi:hypothetical protein